MKNLIAEAEIIKLYKEGLKVVPVGKNDVITPLALDKIKSLNMNIVKKEISNPVEALEGQLTKGSKMNKIAVGSDHTGFKLKNLLSAFLSEKGFEVIDVGTFDENSCDYPDFALAVASKVKDDRADFGIIIDATGIPSAITANKLPGIRAATCYNEFSAKSAREHNDANILVLGAKALGEETVKSIIETWLRTGFAGGRHQNRLNKISAIEEQFLKK